MKSLPWLLALIGLGAVAYVLLNEPVPQLASADTDVDHTDDEVSAWGTKQRVEGAGRKLAGKVKKRAGKTVGNDRLAAEGTLDQVEGSVKDEAGQAAHAVSDAANDLNG